jgi:hypothetical protein
MCDESLANELKVLVEGDPPLANRYNVVLLDPKRHPGALPEAKLLADRLVSAEGQAAIGAYEIDTSSSSTPQRSPIESGGELQRDKCRSPPDPSGDRARLPGDAAWSPLVEIDCAT